MDDSALPFDPASLDRLAAVAIRTGLGLREGQDLIITGSAEALPLVRRIAAEAYRAGAGLVTPVLTDEAVTLARYREAPDLAFDRAPDWLYQGMAAAYGANTARLHIAADNPMALSAEDPAKVSRAARANARAAKPAMERITRFETNWTIVAYPGRAWAQAVFPDLGADAAQKRLADAIFAASRIDRPDPVSAWAAHNADLARRRGWMTAQGFAALRFRSEGTDLTVGLSEGHEWKGGASEARNGITCNPNIPTEEVFTTPHASRVDGRVRATRPLAHQGSLIEGIEVTFEAGKITEARAAKGEAVFRELIDTDDGASRLGEVALVPAASPISESGLLFLNTLFDENAACHIALGQCYSDCLKDGGKLSKAEVVARGGNQSLIHVDWMIGGPDTDIDGIAADGGVTPVFRGGNWAA